MQIGLIRMETFKDKTFESEDKRAWHFCHIQVIKRSKYASDPLGLDVDQFCSQNKIDPVK